MTRITKQVAVRRKAAGYIAPKDRRDCCGGCQYSNAIPSDGSLRCTVLMSEVASSGRCRLWDATAARPTLNCGPFVAKAAA